MHVRRKGSILLVFADLKVWRRHSLHKLWKRNGGGCALRGTGGKNRHQKRMTESRKGERKVGRWQAATEKRSVSSSNPAVVFNKGGGTRRVFHMSVR